LKHTAQESRSSSPLHRLSHPPYAAIAKSTKCFATGHIAKAG